MRTTSYRKTLAVLVGVSMCAQASVASAYTLSIDATPKDIPLAGDTFVTASGSGLDLYSCDLDTPYGARQLNIPEGFEERIGDTSHPWLADTVFSYDGQTGVTAQEEGYIYKANKSDENTWPWKSLPTAGKRDWTSVTLSSDGKKIAAVVNGGQIWISTNSGQTWSQYGDSLSWFRIAMSADGSKLVAAVKGTGSGGSIYRSTDGGVTWTALQGTAGRYWNGLAISADGIHITAVADSDYVFVSNTGGNSWSKEVGTARWGDVAMTPDGKTQIATNLRNGFPFISHDYGGTWTPFGNNWWIAGVAITPDAKTIVLAQNIDYSNPSNDLGPMLYSRNGGDTWGEVYPTGSNEYGWYSAGVSPDGKWAFGGAYMGYPSKRAPFFGGTLPPGSFEYQLDYKTISGPPANWPITIGCQLNKKYVKATVIVHTQPNTCSDAQKAPGTPANTKYPYYPFAYEVKNTGDTFRVDGYPPYVSFCLFNSGPDSVFVPNNTPDELKAFKNAVPDIPWLRIVPKF